MRPLLRLLIQLENEPSGVTFEALGEIVGLVIDEDRSERELLPVPPVALLPVAPLALLPAVPVLPVPLPLEPAPLVPVPLPLVLELLPLVPAPPGLPVPVLPLPDEAPLPELPLPEPVDCAVTTDAPPTARATAKARVESFRCCFMILLLHAPERVIYKTSRPFRREGPGLPTLPARQPRRGPACLLVAFAG